MYTICVQVRAYGHNITGRAGATDMTMQACDGSGRGGVIGLYVDNTNCQKCEDALRASNGESAKHDPPCARNSNVLPQFQEQRAAGIITKQLQNPAYMRNGLLVYPVHCAADGDAATFKRVKEAARVRIY